MYFCKFRIAGESLMPNEITEILGMNPDVSYKKGEIKKLKNEEVTYTEGCWMKNLETDDYNNFQDLILDFLKPFFQKESQIIDIGKRFDITLWIDLYPDGNQFNFHISSDLIAAINKLQISMDISTIYLEPLYHI